MVNLKIELAQHIIKLQAQEIIKTREKIEEYYPSDPDEEWLALSTLAEQLKHWRASI